ncbi:MAG TPA: hypothetical protein VN604_10370 [Nitrospirota bacterium]|nr:hypothetical protein [Nitrospirota bacterium]
MKRRAFLGFFLIGGLISFIKRKLFAGNGQGLKKASFWRKTS